MNNPSSPQSPPGTSGNDSNIEVIIIVLDIPNSNGLGQTVPPGGGGLAGGDSGGAVCIGGQDCSPVRQSGIGGSSNSTNTGGMTVTQLNARYNPPSIHNLIGHCWICDGINWIEHFFTIAS